MVSQLFPDHRCTWSWLSGLQWGQMKQCNDASGSRKMMFKHPRAHLGPLEPSDLQTVMPLFIAFVSFTLHPSPLAIDCNTPNKLTKHTPQARAVTYHNTVHTGSFLFLEAWPSPSSMATAVAIAEFFRFELILDALRSRPSQLYYLGRHGQVVQTMTIMVPLYLYFP